MAGIRLRLYHFPMKKLLILAVCLLSACSSAKLDAERKAAAEVVSAISLLGDEFVV